ncbi:helix-turn-helix domain-containing protein [Saccharopolyspora sp. MS10]|uniref:helix-turn-helix domain-containing protein n=1 Tax=Saccharopolyspora sp. MS10 TaxID=3385973 RepID=UPI0039A12691
MADRSSEAQASGGRGLAGLGDRIRRLRTERSWPEGELASRTGLGEPRLAEVEQERATPSLAELTAIAEALDVALAELFTDAAPGPAAVVLRGDEVPTVESGGVAVQVLTPRSVVPGMYAARYRLAPSETGLRPVQHEGHDWLYVLSGQLRVEFEQDAVVLRPGDSASFGASVAHRLLAPGPAPAEFLAVGATLLAES